MAAALAGVPIYAVFVEPFVGLEWVQHGEVAGVVGEEQVYGVGGIGFFSDTMNFADLRFLDCGEAFADMGVFIEMCHAFILRQIIKHHDGTITDGGEIEGFVGVLERHPLRLVGNFALNSVAASCQVLVALLFLQGEAEANQVVIIKKTRGYGPVWLPV